MPTTLAAGDIAIIGANGDDPDSFGFVALTDIEAGTQITFTDNGWTGSAFRTGEGVFVYTFPAGVPAGTVINIGAVTGMSFAAAGDSIIAYQGTASAPVFLYALDFADGNTTFSGSASNTNTSAVPTGLVLGQTAVAVGQDNVSYNGPTSGTRDELLAAIGNPANWTGDDAVRRAPSTLTFTVGGASTFNVSDATVAEGDSGTTTLTFTVSRTVGIGSASVSYATTDGSATAGSDYVAQTGMVTFADGETSRTITITVNGDLDIEGAESLALTLSNPVGASISDGQGVGTIANDDVAPAGPPPFINEFHYDNPGSDTGEFIEIAGAAGTDLTGYSLVLYNGSNGTTYATT
ncbi:MAG: Calx-beta domain-containing protein, partial [Brevundimonas sp.]